MNMKKIYHIYTPSRQDPVFLERMSIGREGLLSDLISSIEEQSKKPTHQHWLLVGPRGIGKSHIVALLIHRVRSTPAFKACWLPVCFPEEAAGILTLRDFFEKVVRLAIEELKNEGLIDEARRFDAFLEALHEESSNRRAMNRIKAFLVDWKNNNKRKILVLVENADRVIGSRIAGKLTDEKWLRDVLMNDDIFLFIATAPTFFKQVENRDHPLYELFRIEVIEELDFDQSLELLIKYAREEGRSDLVKHFEARKNRIEAIYTLTGGNPRLVIMLYDLIQDSIAGIDDVEISFFNLLDELTPYFQSRTSLLNPQEEKVLVAFAEGPQLLTPAEVGKKIRMPTNQVTANLNRLISSGFIKRIEKPIKGRKGTLYCLSETIYRYWHQMHSESNRVMAEIFVRFIVLFYTYQEIERMYTESASNQGIEKNAQRGLADIPRELHYLGTARSIAAQEEKSKLLAQLQDAFDKNMPGDEIERIFHQLMEVSPDDCVALNNYSAFLVASGDLETAISYLEKAAKVTEREEFKKYRPQIYNNWGNALFGLAGLREDEGLYFESFEKYGMAWLLIKGRCEFDHPLMVNTGLMLVLTGFIADKEDDANHAFIELLGSLSKVTDLEAAVPYFFDFFKYMAKLGKIDPARGFLEQLLNTRFKKALGSLIPLRFLFEYLDKKDDTIIRRQPPEVQKVLNEIIKEIG